MGAKGLLKRVWAKLSGRGGKPVPDPAWLDLYRRGGQRAQVDLVRATAEEVYLHGWVMLPAADRDAPVRVWWNDAELPATRFPRPDVQGAYWWAAGEFEAVGVMAKGTVPVGEWNRIRYEADSHPVGCVWWYSTADEGLPLPDDSRRVRVHGSDDVAAFRVTGAMAVGQLRSGYEQVTGQKWDAIGELLDWGCGSGRTTRFLQRTPVKVTGVDVDADNVAWCQANLPFAAFRTIPLLPPTDLPTNGFDAATGVSIFTHLGEEVQFAWLDELARLLRPGGHLLVTTHGPAAMAYSQVTPAEQRPLAKTGFADRPSAVLAGHIADAGYYRDTFHTHEYIRREWRKRFEVRAVLPAHVGQQDLVVLRKK